MLLSKSCEYGLRASLYLATLNKEGYVSIGEISEKLDISFPFLTKIFQKLTQAGLMESLRGPKGGVALAQAASQIRLMDIVKAIDGDDLFTQCVLGLPGCGNRKPCPLHQAWSVERERLAAMFEGKTLQSLALDLESFDLRLAVIPEA